MSAASVGLGTTVASSYHGQNIRIYSEEEKITRVFDTFPKSRLMVESSGGRSRREAEEVEEPQ